MKFATAVTVLSSLLVQTEAVKTGALARPDAPAVDIFAAMSEGAYTKKLRTTSCPKKCQSGDTSTYPYECGLLTNTECFCNGYAYVYNNIITSGQCFGTSYFGNPCAKLGQLGYRATISGGTCDYVSGAFSSPLVGDGSFNVIEVSPNYSGLMGYSCTPGAQLDMTMLYGCQN